MTCGPGPERDIARGAWIPVWTVPLRRPRSDPSGVGWGTSLAGAGLPPQGAGQRLRDGSVVLGEQYTGHGVMVVRKTYALVLDRQALCLWDAIMITTFDSGQPVPRNPVIHLSSPSISGSVVTYGESTPVALRRPSAVLDAEGLFYVRTEKE